MRTWIILALFLAAPAAHAECQSCTEPVVPVVVAGGDYDLLVRKENNDFELVRGLTESECKFMRARALGEPATDAERKNEEAARQNRVTAREKNTAAMEAVCNSETHGGSHVLGDEMYWCLDGKIASRSSPVYSLVQIYPTSVRTAECFR